MGARGETVRATHHQRISSGDSTGPPARTWARTTAAWLARATAAWLARASLRKGDNGSMPSRPPAPRRPLKNSPFSAPEPPPHHHFQVNDRVSHDRHGLGSVIRLEGDRVVVRFREQTVSVSRTSSKLHAL